MATEWNGVLSGVDEVINQHLSIGKYGFRHDKTAQSLKVQPPGFSATTLLDALIDRLENNLRAKRESAQESSGTKLGASKENWREKSPREFHQDRKPERALEHWIANEAGPEDDTWTWWNQMPIASGLVGYRSDRTRAVDLACKNKNDKSHYRLIELKQDRNAGSPLFSLMEIALYGLVYFALRKNSDAEWLAEDWLNNAIFSAQKIELCVLAPHDYFGEGRYNLRWLEDELSAAVAIKCKEHFGSELTMSLASYVLPENLKCSTTESGNKTILPSLNAESKASVIANLLTKRVFIA